MLPSMAETLGPLYSCKRGVLWRRWRNLTSKVSKLLFTSTVLELLDTPLYKYTQVVYFSLFFHYNNVCTNATQCYVIRTLTVLFNKRSGPTLELNKLQVSCQKCETNWTLLARHTGFDIAVIWNNVTSYEVTCHLAVNMLKEERGSITNVTAYWYTKGAEILVCFYCYNLFTADKE